MSKNKSRIDYDRAEEDLWDQTDSEEPFGIRDYRNEREFRGYMKEHGLNPDKYIKNTNNKNSGNDDLCFLTTACIRARGLSDDCMELQTLRAYRDGWLKNQPGGKEDIEEYYRIAPRVVRNVNRTADAQKRWTALYESLVVPCVQWILQGRNEDAYRLYRETVLALNKEYPED